MLLFTQAAFASRPCVDAGMSAASALAADKDHGCETAVSEVNLCVMECTDGDKVSAHAPLLIPPAATHAVLTLAVSDSTHLRRGRPGLQIATHDPPKTLRFCSFLI